MTEISGVSGLRGVREQRDELLRVLKAALKQTNCDGDLCLYEWHDAARRVIGEVEEAALSLPPSPQPFLWAIEKANGEWYDGDNCVFGDMASAQDSVDESNDNLPKEDWLRVVPLYRAGAQGQVQGVQASLEKLADKWDSADYAIAEVKNLLLPQEQCAIELRQFAHSIFQNEERAEIEKLRADVSSQAGQAPSESGTMELLRDANDKLRSAYQIAARQGVDTNWESFKNRVHESLVRQQKILFPQ